MQASKILLISGMIAILAAMGYCSYQVHKLSEQQKRIKEDYSTVNSITFGLFSVNQWKDKVTAIVNRQIRDFDFTKEQQAKLQKEIEEILHALINKAMAMINKPKKGFGANMKKAAINAFVDDKKLHAQVPTFAREIVKQINKPSSKKRLKSLATSKLKELEKTTFDSSITAEKTVTKRIYNRYHVNNGDQFTRRADELLAEIRTKSYAYSYGVLGCLLAIAALWWAMRKTISLHKTFFLLSIVGAVIILVAGVSTAMIDVEARITEFRFTLLGEDILFKDQILFFQSKSILDVVSILVKTGKFDSVLVGSLIFCFSILFPFAKLSSTVVYLFNKAGWMRGRVIKYFAFESGKWSMADV
ncbi:MAG: paraquat-inducible protein A, partial [Mucilaginibacter polytrichastri]|nr:paraquat-inducible protein A [Mucilaginibacter polytrichastri]